MNARALLFVGLFATTLASSSCLGEATPAGKLKLLEGFEAELLYSVPRDQQGSWVSLTADDKGRLIASDQYGRLYRITPPALGADAGETKVEQLETAAGGAHGLLYAFDSLYVVQNERDAGLYRLRDTTGDDQFDEVKLLRTLKGGGEHGPHAVVLGPDKKSLYVCCGNHTDLPPLEKSRVPRNWQEDLLLPRMWDANGHARGRLAPGGFICRTDPDGKQWELVSIGYRNEYDIAFNADGELFTFDADMEWDIGSPWYRPTRINHATSGSEFGWRSGTGKWPEYYLDSLPAVVDIGPGSPTGIVFGTGAKFPAKYQHAMFVCDWSYGIIYAIHMEATGSSYFGTAEQFATAAPLPATDILVHPIDGALYFTVGGRRAQSGLYRITYTGSESTAKDVGQNPDTAQARSKRRQLESLHKPHDDPAAVDLAWAHLADRDRHIRYAARIALEHQPVDKWQQRVIQEANPRKRIAATVALARTGDPSLRDQLRHMLNTISWTELGYSDRLDLCRAYALIFARMGQPLESAREAVIQQLTPHYPADTEALNRELCRLMVYLQAPDAAAKTMALLKQAPTQEEQVHYVLALRNLTAGWNDELRRDYFSWFNRSGEFKGGHSFAKFLVNIRNEAMAKLDDDTRKQLEAILAETPSSEPNIVFEPREVVSEWKVNDLLTSKTPKHDFGNGRRMFAVAQCFKCHRVRGEGGSVGPDLTGVGKRYDDQYLLESLIEPSKVVSDQYQATTFVLEDGRAISGRVANIAGNNIMVMTDMLNPGRMANVPADRVEERHPSKLSLMPTGLLNTLQKDEIADLLAYLKSGGDPAHELFDN